jgi:hypothetical protein
MFILDTNIPVTKWKHNPRCEPFAVFLREGICKLLAKRWNYIDACKTARLCAILETQCAILQAQFRLVEKVSN